MKTKTLHEVFPIYKVEENCILSKQGDITVAYKIHLPEIFSLSTDEFEAIHNAWTKAVRVLPIHTIIHKQDWFTQCQYTGDFQKDNYTFSSLSSERFFNERPFLYHECYIYITRRANQKRPVTALTSSLITGKLVPEGTISALLIEQFIEKTSQFVKIMTDTGFLRIERLTNEDICGSEAPGLLEKYCFLQTGHEKRMVKDIQLLPSLKVGKLDCQIYTMADVDDLPGLAGQRMNYDKYSTDRTKFSIGFPAPLCQLLNCNHIYNQYIVIDDGQETIRKMESKRLRLQSLSKYSRDNAISKDATNQFLNEAISAQRQPVKAHYSIITWTDNPNEAKEISNKVASALSQLNANTKQESVNAAQLFWSAIPGNAAELPLHETFDTFVEQACCFFNNETSYRSSLSPTGLRLGDRLTGYPIWVDPSDEVMGKITANRNKVVISSSGAGKSFFCGHFLRSYYEQGSHIVVVDVGHSYKTLCDLVNGYYFTYTEQNPIQFNPFYVDETGMDTEKKESLKALLLSLWKKEDETFTRAEYVSLSNALQSYYEILAVKSEVFPCFNSFYEFLRDDFAEELSKQGVKDKNFDISNMLYVLKPFYKGGEFDYLLNAKENLDMLDQPFIVFELDNLKDHPVLLPIVCLMVCSVFISKMRKLKGVRKIILIEEAWKAIARAGMAEYIKYLFKTVRKHFGEAIVVSQEVDDIISSPIIKETIINNSDCKIILDQSKYLNKFDKIQEALGLTDKEKAMILSLNKANDPNRKYKEVFIGLGSTYSRVYRVEVSLEEYLTYTTEEKEKVQVQAYAAKYGSTRKGIEMLAKHLRQVA